MARNPPRQARRRGAAASADAPPAAPAPASPAPASASSPAATGKAAPFKPEVLAAPLLWSWRIDGTLAAVLLAVAFAVFANSLPNGYVYDDIIVIRDNPMLDRTWELREFFTRSYLDGENDRLFRPLTIWSFALGKELFGPGPLHVRWTNVLLNAALAPMIHLLLLWLLRRRDIAFIAALLFAIHPTHTEVVANGVGRSELASMICMVGGCVLHLLHLRAVWRDQRLGKEQALWGVATTPRPWITLAPALVLYFIGMLFKETSVVLPGLLFFMEWLIVRRGDLMAMVAVSGRYFVYALPLVVAIVLRSGAIGLGTPPVQEVMQGSSRANIFFYGNETLLRYIIQLVLPLPGSLQAEYSDYTNPIRSTIADPMVFASLVAWAAVALAVWQCARRGWWIPVLGVAWYFLVMLPTSNVLVPIGTVRADRLQFAPSLGFALVCAWGASLLLARNRAAGVALVTIVSLGYAAVSIDRNRDWRSSETLWPVTLEQNPGNAVAWSFNADFRRDAARRALAEGDAEEAERLFEDAVVHYRRAMELRGQLGFYYRETANSLAAMQAERGLVDEARAIYEETVARQPRNPIAMINLAALVLSNDRNPRRALDLLDRALALDPAQFAVWVNKSQAHNLLNEFDEALAAIERAKALDPDHPQLPAAEQVIRDRMAATRAATPP